MAGIHQAVKPPSERGAADAMPAIDTLTTLSVIDSSLTWTLLSDFSYLPPSSAQVSHLPSATDASHLASSADLSHLVGSTQDLYKKTTSPMSDLLSADVALEGPHTMGSFSSVPSIAGGRPDAMTTLSTTPVLQPTLTVDAIWSSFATEIPTSVVVTVPAISISFTPATTSSIIITTTALTAIPGPDDGPKIPGENPPVQVPPSITSLLTLVTTMPSFTLEQPTTLKAAVTSEAAVTSTPATMENSSAVVIMTSQSTDTVGLLTTFLTLASPTSMATAPTPISYDPGSKSHGTKSLTVGTTIGIVIGVCSSVPIVILAIVGWKSWSKKRAERKAKQQAEKERKEREQLARTTKIEAIRSQYPSYFYDSDPMRD